MKSPIKLSKFYVTTKFMTIKEIAKNYEHSKFNRNINPTHVNKLKQSIAEIGMLINITVNKRTGSIVDGNHRTEAAFQLVRDGIIDESQKFLVNIVDMSEKEEQEVIQAIQHSSKRWTGHDFIDMNYNLNNENYTRFVDFAMSHDLTHKGNKIIPRYAGAIIKGTAENSKINNGTFECTEDEIKRAHTIHDEVKEMLNIFGLTCTAFTEPMIAQWHKFRELTLKTFGEYDFDTM